VVNGIAVTAH